jgi:hypothetical protein
MKTIAFVRPDPTTNNGIYAVAGSALDLIQGSGQQAKWSGTKFPPKPGDRVTVNFNGFGGGTVLDYVCLDQWLGVLVKLDKQPGWHLKQNGPQECITAFGLELDY